MDKYDFENDTLEQSSAEELHGQANEQEQAFDEPAKKKLKFDSSWIMYGVGGIAVLFAAYMFYSITFPSSNKPQKAPPPQTLEQNMTPVHAEIKPPAPQTNDVNTRALNASMNQMQSQTQNALNEVAQNLKAEAKFVSEGMKSIANQQKQMAENQEKITKMIADLNDRINGIQTGLDQANAQVKHMANLQQSLTSVSQQLSMLQAERTNMADPLQLSAVMPNRAWLQNSKGQTIAITVGTQLQGYGSVTKIDSDHDKVYTSSGYVFQ